MVPPPPSKKRKKTHTEQSNTENNSRYQTTASKQLHDDMWHWSTDRRVGVGRWTACQCKCSDMPGSGSESLRVHSTETWCCWDISVHWWCFEQQRWDCYVLQLPWSTWLERSCVWGKSTKWGIHSEFCNNGFFLACGDFEGIFNHSFPPPLHFFSFFIIFFEVKISLHTLFPLFMPGSEHGSSASWDDCGWMFPDKLWMSAFLDRFPKYAWTVA